MHMKQWLKTLFIPHSENNQHPHFWKDKSIAILLAIILIVELATISQSFLLFKKDSFLAAVLPAVLVAFTNQERVANAATPLQENELLTKAAELKAKDMASRGYFSHNTPEGLLPWHWLTNVGYRYSYAGENLAVNFTDSKDVIDAWMRSPTHRDNIVKSAYTEIGIAMAEGIYQDKPAIFVVQFFGKPVKVEPTKTATVVSTSTSTKTSVATSTPVVHFSTSSVSTSSFVAGAESTIAQNTNTKPNFIYNILSSPRHTGRNILIVLLGVVIAAFLLILLINGKVHHPRILLLVIAFIVIIIGLIFLNTKLLKDPIQIGSTVEVYNS